MPLVWTHGAWSKTDAVRKITRIQTPFSKLSRTMKPNMFIINLLLCMWNLQNLLENLFWGIDTSGVTDFSGVFTNTFESYARSNIAAARHQDSRKTI